MTLKELAENAFTELITAAQAMTADQIRPVPLRLKEQIGTLLSSKKMNPALYLSFDFFVGIYAPIVAPFCIPLLLTLTITLRTKLFDKFCKKKKTD